MYTELGMLSRHDLIYSQAYYVSQRYGEIQGVDIQWWTLFNG